MPFSDPEVYEKYKKLYYLKNKERIKARVTKYQIENKEKLRVWRSAYFKKRRLTDPDFRKKRNELTDRWRAKNKDKEKAPRKKYRDMKFKTDPSYKVLHNCRGRLHALMRHRIFKKSGKTIDLIGCAKSDLKTHLESLFLPGMTWENYGVRGWHIDHIRPCASFNLMDPEQQRCCFHYTNLQPLWAADNIRKKDKII